MASVFFPTHSQNCFKVPSGRLLDAEKRVHYNRSYWRSVVHHRERRDLNVNIWGKVSAFFQKRYSIEDSQDFFRLWKEIGQKEWSFSQLLTVERLHAIDAAFQKQLAYHGPGMAHRQAYLPQTIHPATGLMVNAILHGGSFSKEMLHPPLARAVFLVNDPDWLQQWREALQLELAHLTRHPPKLKQEEHVWRQYVGNILALLPFGYPVDGEVYFIPYLDENLSCREVKYRIEAIPLTSSDLVTPLSAVGFSPVDDTQAPFLLSFLGTTFPAGNGFATSIKADFTPGQSVGQNAYQQGREKIALWLKGKTKVQLFGTSLGGALAFHTLLDHHSKLTRIDVYNPPGLYKPCWEGRLFDEGCSINIYMQAGDIVPQMGFWPAGKQVNVFRIIPHQPEIYESFVLSHVRAFSGCRKVTFLKCDPAVENEGALRKQLTWVHRYLGPYLFYYPACFALCCYRICSLAFTPKIL